MQSFQSILERAAHRHGGEDVIRERFSKPGYDDGVNYGEVPHSDDRWLANFTMRIFQAGFNWRVIETKWDGFEEAFWGFKVDRCARIDLDDMEKLTSNKAIVRNPKKIKTVAVNAQMIQRMREEKGSADNFIRSWPSDDYIGLLDYLQKNGSHLGAGSASYALRMGSIPSFVLSRDVTAALIHAGVIDKPATGKGARRAVQEAFNQWSKESGENLTFISRVLAHSIDAG